MKWLNYHHLLYFHTVAREGGLRPAAEQLHVSVSTISGQIKQLEETLGEQLFERVGRRLELTEVGRFVQGYAKEIFSLGDELVGALAERPGDRPLPVRVGVADVLPKLLVRHILEPALDLERPVELTCTEDRPDNLLAALALHELDVVLSDAPIAPGSGIRAYNHLLGESGLSFFAAPKLARDLGPGFPQNLDGAPAVLPLARTTMRRALDQWFEDLRVRPRMVAQFEDSALVKVFGQDGYGFFAVPTVVEASVVEQHHVEVIGRTDAVQQRVYAISAERRIRNPAVVAIRSTARSTLFM